MGASYVKLFKLLLDKKMSKGELCKAAGISGSSLAKLRKGDNVTTDLLTRICHVLKCDFSDIMEMEHDNNLEPINTAPIEIKSNE